MKKFGLVTKHEGPSQC